MDADFTGESGLRNALCWKCI